MRRASIIKFSLPLAVSVLALSLGGAAFAEPKKEPLPASIVSAKAGPYVKTSLDPKPVAPSSATPDAPEKTASQPVKDKEGDKTSSPPPLPKIVNRDKTSLPAAPAADAPPSPAPAAVSGEGVSALLKGPQNKGKYIKIPAPTVDLTPPPPAATQKPEESSKSTPSEKNTPSDQSRKAEADSVINDLEDLASAPPPPPQRDAKTGNVMLPNKSRTVVVEQGSVVLDSSALKTIIEAQNRDDLVGYGNTMGKSLAENLTLLSQFYSFSLKIGSGKPSEASAPTAAAKPKLAPVPSDTKTKPKKTKKASRKKR
jgi:hypothetical protein